jgi:hypothetical protein
LRHDRVTSIEWETHQHMLPPPAATHESDGWDSNSTTSTNDYLPDYQLYDKADFMDYCQRDLDLQHYPLLVATSDYDSDGNYNYRSDSEDHSDTAGPFDQGFSPFEDFESDVSEQHPSPHPYPYVHRPTSIYTCSNVPLRQSQSPRPYTEAETLRRSKHSRNRVDSDEWERRRYKSPPPPPSAKRQPPEHA